MKTLECLAVVFGCCTLFSILYWRIINVVLLKQIRFNLFALRDEARRIAAENGLGNDVHFKYVEQLVCKTIRFAPSISLSGFLFTTRLNWRAFALEEAEKRQIDEFELEADKRFVAIRDATAKFALLTMMFNSPFLVFLTLVIALILVALGKISRLGMYRQAEQYVDIVGDSNAQVAQMAC
jgi:hypothetical protein